MHNCSCRHSQTCNHQLLMVWLTLTYIQTLAHAHADTHASTRTKPTLSFANLRCISETCARRCWCSNLAMCATDTWMRLLNQLWQVRLSLTHSFLAVQFLPCLRIFLLRLSLSVPLLPFLPLFLLFFSPSDATRVLSQIGRCLWVWSQPIFSKNRPPSAFLMCVHSFTTCWYVNLSSHC